MSGFRIVDVLDGHRYLGVQCTACEAVVWEPVVAGQQLEDIVGQCREHICAEPEESGFMLYGW